MSTLVKAPVKNNQTEKNLQLFEGYIRDKKIVIADKNSTSRAGIARILTGLGAKGINIGTATDYDHAIKEIERLKPHIIVCDYELGNRSGLELIQSLKKLSPDYNKSLFIIVTGNSSQAAVAQAAEEDVDTYIIKPYTVEIIRQCLLKAAMAKLYPSEYMKKVDEGKKLLEELKATEAKAIFIEAQKLDPKPALACFYQGQAEELELVIEQAQSAYSEGLNFNKIHYKCMTGLFDVLMKKQKTADAYDVVKKISRYFPANPQRLAQVLRLAIMTKSYEDVERYYQAFISLDARNEELIRYICAALVVCGKHYISTNNPSRGLDLFKKAAVTGVGKIKILKEIILALYEHGMLKHAREYLARFPLEQRDSVEYQSLNYVVGSEEVPATLAISQGRELVSKGIYDPMIYQVLIKKSVLEGYREQAEELIESGVKRWPEQSALFEKLTKYMFSIPAKKAAT